jgi:putative peptidoglycan lipid II flippase
MATCRSGGVAHAAGILFIATLVSRLLGMLRDSLIAGRLGDGTAADAYQAAFNLPDSIYFLLAGGALAAMFVPVFRAYLDRGDEEGAWKTFSILATIISVAAIAFVVVAELFTPAFVRLLNPVYKSAAFFHMAVPLTRIIVPGQIFFLVGGLLVAAQNARHRFLIPALAPCLYNLGTIIGLTVFYHRFGIAAAVWGSLIGAFIGSFAVQWTAARRVGMRFMPSLDVKHPGVRAVGRLMLPVILGASLPSIDQLVNAGFAGHLPYGSLTALRYAYRLMLIPIGLFGQAAGIAVLPTLATLATARRNTEFRESMNRGLGMILFLTIPASALLFLLAAPLVTVLYQHGAFGWRDTLRTADALRLYSLGIFAWSAQSLLTRGFYSLKDSRTPVIFGTIATVVFVALNYVALRSGMGVGGLALATSASVALNVISLYLRMRTRLRGFQVRRLSGSVVRTVLATVALGVVVEVVALMTARLGDPLHSHLIAIVTVAVAGVAGIGAFAMAARAMHMAEFRSVTRLVRGMAR